MSIDFFTLMKSELSLILIIFLLLFLKVWDGIKSNKTLLNGINFLLLINFIIGFFDYPASTLFNGMFNHNSILNTEKLLLNIGTLIISLQAYDWVKNHKHLLEFYILMLSTLLGMFFMISAGNFLMFYLGLELATIPLAALVNFDLDKRKSSEAAMKMILLSAFSSGIMLFGISIIYGTTGTLKFSELPTLLTGGHLQILALIFTFTGFAFKLSAVPFHLWTADVYEGAPVPITTYLSVISKAAVVFVFISVLNPLFVNLANLWYNLLFLVIILTITVGNLFAIRQTNIKRFLAFSSIAQVGYILLGLSAGNQMGSTSAIYFLIVYLFSNLGVFGAVALISAQTGKENISDYKGLYKKNPALSWVLAIALFSLAGIPPTAGFFGKMFLVTAGASHGNYILVTLAVLNMVVSLYYYLMIVKAIFVDANDEALSKLTISWPMKLSFIICIAGIVVTGFYGDLYEFINQLFKI